MTKPSADTVLERRLEDAFGGAHDDPRWEGEPWTDPLGRLRRARRAHGRRVAIASGLSVAALAGGVLAAVSAVPGARDRVGVTAPMAGGQTGTGLDWLLTRDQFNLYVAAHPSPSPSTVKVPSPAPTDGELTTLQADVAAALPAGAHFVRADAADGGNAGQAIVSVKLPDGTPVVVQRQQLRYPLEDPGYNGASPVPTATTGPSPAQPRLTELYSDPVTWGTGTAYTVVTGNVMGMGLPAEGGWNGPFVWAVTADGWFTSWTAPVSVDRLLGWARAADAHFVGG